MLSLHTSPDQQMVLQQQREQQLRVQVLERTLMLQNHQAQLLANMEERSLELHNQSMTAIQQEMQHTADLRSSREAIDRLYAEDQISARWLAIGVDIGVTYSKEDRERFRSHGKVVPPHTIPEEYWPMRCDLEEVVGELKWQGQFLNVYALPYGSRDDIETEALRLYKIKYHTANIPVQAGTKQKLLWFAQDRGVITRATNTVLSRYAQQVEKGSEYHVLDSLKLDLLDEEDRRLEKVAEKELAKMLELREQQETALEDSRRVVNSNKKRERDQLRAILSGSSAMQQLSIDSLSSKQRTTM